MNVDRFLRREEIALRLGTSARTVARLFANGDLPVVQIGRTRSVPESAVDAFARRKAGEAVSAAAARRAERGR
ncbi:excisionase family DNA-binding protein [Methylopila sp. Yamaguchi]|uniref:excisionase family DNA-binding protein n=1 Tax=Methylopila sp. Yamaguchi TaxID=1437817 RepID=UPI0026C1C832